MDQRSNKAPEVQLPTLFWLDGRPVHQLIGCTSGGDGGQGGSGGGDGGNGQGGNGNGDGGSGGSGGADSGQGGGAGGDADKPVSRAEFDSLMSRMQAADRAKTAAERRVAELEGKDKSDLEKAQAERDAAKAEADQLRADRQAMLTSNAFLTVKDAPTWHSNAAALKLLDTSLLTIEDNGEVKGMEAAVEKLKKDHPYLVKTDSSKDDGKDDKEGKGGGSGQGGNGGGGSGQQQSGASNNGGAGSGGKQVDRGALEKKYPALRGRPRS